MKTIRSRGPNIFRTYKNVLLAFLEYYLGLELIKYPERYGAPGQLVVLGIEKITKATNSRALFQRAESKQVFFEWRKWQEDFKN